MSCLLKGRALKAPLRVPSESDVAEPSEAREAEPAGAGRHWAAFAVVAVAGLALFFAIPDMPVYGDLNSPANSGVGMEYMARTPNEIAVPNVVTAVLASYRGYDTFGEVVVIFTAALGVILLLGFGNRRKNGEGE